MNEFVPHIFGGALLGLAGGLHCACMCGGLTSASLSLFAVTSARQGAVTIALISTGRILAYVGLGLLAAGSAGFAQDLMAIPAPSKLMALVGAGTLMWIGFSTAGLLPTFAGAPGAGLASTRPFTTVASFFHALRHNNPHLASLTTGLGWGFAPCPLLYAALFMAMLTGSWSGGALWMLGFGLGTLPAVLMSATGVSYIRSLNIKKTARIAVGLAIALFGFATVYFDFGLFSGLCKVR